MVLSHPSANSIRRGGGIQGLLYQPLVHRIAVVSHCFHAAWDWARTFSNGTPDSTMVAQ